MTPRVRPKAKIHTREYAEHLGAQQDLRDAAAEFDERRQELMADVQRQFGLPTSARSDGVYRPDPEGPSWFLDRAWASGAEVLRDHIPSPNVQGPARRAAGWRASKGAT